MNRQQHKTRWVMVGVGLVIMGLGLNALGATVRYQYDALNRVQRVEDYRQGFAFDYQYDAAGNRISAGQLQIALLRVMTTGSGSGIVTSTPEGITCGSDCEEVYAAGTVVTLTAAPNSDSNFAGWSGGGCSDSPSCSVTLSSAQTVTATFSALPAAYLLWTQ
ncbi:MAG: hypothetical protein JW896_12995 [Deltaproteobacteria bacterium]|nr:hypothetical protein [Deltaproteobacteria bacterium]